MDYLDARELYHHGIKGQRWGIRRYQNEDGTLTSKGKTRYNTYSDEKSKYSISEHATKAGIAFASTILATFGATVAAAKMHKNELISDKTYDKAFSLINNMYHLSPVIAATQFIPSKSEHSTKK